jgi:hypothetical protein
MAIKLASLFIELGVNADQLTAELTRTSNETRNWSKSIEKAAKVAKTSLLLVGAAGVTAAAGIAAIYVSNARTLDALGKTASKLGDTTEALKEFGIAAQLGGVSVDSAEVALQRMTRRLAEAAQGTGEAKNAIKELGLDAADLAAQRPSEAFEEIAIALADIPLQADKVRLAMKFFDTEGVALVNVTVNELIKASEAVEAFGGALTSIEVRQIEAANDSMLLLGLSFDLITDRLTAKIAPAVDAFATSLFESAKQGQQLDSVMDTFVGTVVGGIADVADAAGSILRFIDGRSELAAGGLVGYLLGGKLGFLAGTAATASFDVLSANFDAIKAKFNLTLSDAERAEIDLRRIVAKMELLSVPGLGAISSLGDVDDQLAGLEKQRREIATVLSDLGEFDRITAIQFGGAETAITGAGDALEALAAALRATDGVGPLGELVPPGTAAANDDTAGAAPPIIFDTASIYQTQIDELTAQNEKKLAIHDAYFSQQIAQEAQFQNTWSLFQRSGAKDRFSILTNETSGALGILGQHSRKMFELNKAVGLANATVYIAEGMTAAWKLGWPLGAVAAATVALNGAAQIASINAAKFGQAKIATPVSNVDSSVGLGNVAQSTTTNSTNTETSSSIVVQIYPPIGASQEQIDEAINLAVARNVESGQMIPDTEIIFNNRAIA